MTNDGQAPTVLTWREAVDISTYNLCPGVRIVGVEQGCGDSAYVIDWVRAARPAVLLVALGKPLQERWMLQHLTRLNARGAIAVGALFDYLAGRVRRAPQWMRAMRCEWLFRLRVEPRRLWRRYLAGNSQFLWRVVTSTMRREHSS